MYGLECIFMPYDEHTCNILYDSAYSVQPNKASFGLQLIEQALFDERTDKAAIISPKGCTGVASYHISDHALRIWGFGVVEPKQGHGTFLMNAMKEHARRKGCTKIEAMGVLNNAAGFYHKNGFDSFMVCRLSN